MFIRHRAASTRWLGSFLTAKNVTLTWYRLSNITVYSSRTLLSPIYFLEFQQVDVQICDRIPGKKSTVEIRISFHFFSFEIWPWVWKGNLGIWAFHNISTTNQHCSQESGQKNCKSAPASAWRASGCLYGREINPPTASPPPGQNKMTTQVINFANLLIKKLLRT